MQQNSFRVADARRVEQLAARLAEQMVADLGSELHLVGIRRRGAPLAQMVYDHLTRRGAGVSSGELTLKRYSDDLDIVHEQPALADEALQLPSGHPTVVLVDDVLYTGRTLLRAARCLVEAGAGQVHCAVLCVREGQQVPVRVDYVGLRLDVGPRGIVDVEMPPYEDAAGVILRHRDEHGSLR